MTFEPDKLFDVRGRTAVITGAGGALCGVMSEALAALGVRVALLDIDLGKAQAKAETIAKAGGTAQAFACDVLDAARISRCRQAVEDLWGPADFLINGAGGNDPRGTTGPEHYRPGPADPGAGPSFFELDPAGFSHVFNLNFLSAFLVTQAFAKSMAERGRGAIVNISSMSAFTPLTKVGGYSAAKAAVSNFTRWLAVHFAPAGIRVNALAPGFFMTEQLKFMHIDKETGELTPRARKVVAHTPMGRYGRPEDLVGTLVWLLSEASAFVTGVVVPVDGGFSSYTL